MARFSRRRKEAERIETELSALRERLDAIGSRLDDVVTAVAREEKRVDDVVEKSGEFDARISQIGVEVTHQLDELSTDLERLAQEQARYQIAFRQDLAEVADAMKNTPS